MRTLKTTIKLQKQRWHELCVMDDNCFLCFSCMTKSSNRRPIEDQVFCVEANACLITEMPQHQHVPMWKTICTFFLRLKGFATVNGRGISCDHCIQRGTDINKICSLIHWFIQQIIMSYHDLTLLFVFLLLDQMPLCCGLGEDPCWPLCSPPVGNSEGPSNW